MELLKKEVESFLEVCSAPKGESADILSGRLEEKIVPERYTAKKGNKGIGYCCVMAGEEGISFQKLGHVGVLIKSFRNRVGQNRYDVDGMC